jgi:hypothetical protein
LHTSCAGGGRQVRFFVVVFLGISDEGRSGPSPYFQDCARPLGNGNNLFISVSDFENTVKNAANEPRGMNHANERRNLPRLAAGGLSGLRRAAASAQGATLAPSGLSRRTAPAGRRRFLLDRRGQDCGHRKKIRDVPLPNTPGFREFYHKLARAFKKSKHVAQIQIAR